MSRAILALDVGEKRIGVAQGDEDMKIAFPYDVIEVDGNEIEAVSEQVLANDVTTLVVGYPRNQSGEPTAQTQFVEAFVTRLADVPVEIVFQDESLTSVLAEERLRSYGKPYSKGDIDAQAAMLILEDYLEIR